MPPYLSRLHKFPCPPEGLSQWPFLQSVNSHISKFPSLRTVEALFTGDYFPHASDSFSSASFTQERQGANAGCEVLGLSLVSYFQASLIVFLPNLSLILPIPCPNLPHFPINYHPAGNNTIMQAIFQT